MEVVSGDNWSYKMCRTPDRIYVATNKPTPRFLQTGCQPTMSKQLQGDSNNNNNTSICKAHNVSIRAESEAPAVARWRVWLEGLTI